MDILPYGHFLIHQIFMDISLLWTICHMVFLHIDPLRALHLILKYAFVSIKAKILIVQKLYVYKYLKSSALENQSPKSLNHENSCPRDFVRITLAIAAAKGQLISKGLFDAIVWTKKPTIF